MKHNIKWYDGRVGTVWIKGMPEAIFGVISVRRFGRVIEVRCDGENGLATIWLLRRHDVVVIGANN
jgi:hypothetical protein